MCRGKGRGGTEEKKGEGRDRKGGEERTEKEGSGEGENRHTNPIVCFRRRWSGAGRSWSGNGPNISLL